MPSLQISTQMEAFRMQPEHFVAYIGLTLAFVFLVWLTDTRARPLGSTFVLWGLLLIVFSCGYALIAVPTMMVLTPAMMKVGFLLVLGGVAWSLLAACPRESASKEADLV